MSTGTDRTTTTVHLLRHGEVHNPDGVLYGRMDGYHLSELGGRMAQRAADALADRDVAFVAASPLERAQETAAPVASAHGLEVGTDARVIESGNAFQGKRFGMGDHVLWKPAAWRHLWNPWRPSWGEPYVEVVARMKAAVADARDAALGREAVLVSHQLPIWMTRLHAENRSYLHLPTRRQCTLCSLTSLTFEGDRLVTVRYSEPAADLIPAKDRNKAFSSGSDTSSDTAAGPGPATS
ncbi:MAG: histidine phosphatase family protein [Nocardioides sp.]